MNRVYLASPYTHPDPAVRTRRARAVSRAAACLMRRGEIVYSPVSMGHAIAEAAPELPHDFEWWQHQCMPYLEWADELIVLRLPGWAESRGVKEEIAEARKRGIPITYMTIGMAEGEAA